MSAASEHRFRQVSSPSCRREGLLTAQNLCQLFSKPDSYAPIAPAIIGQDARMSASKSPHVWVPSGR